MLKEFISNPQWGQLLQFIHNLMFRFSIHHLSIKTIVQKIKQRKNFFIFVYLFVLFNPASHPNQQLCLRKKKKILSTFFFVKTTYFKLLFLFF